MHISTIFAGCSIVSMRWAVAGTKAMARAAAFGHRADVSWALVKGRVRRNLPAELAPL
ncbi:MAG: hypothetical protein ACJAVR_001034 [Paracoccaceae bacterium]|jgi:hypothetical protein